MHSAKSSLFLKNFRFLEIFTLLKVNLHLKLRLVILHAIYCKFIYFMLLFLLERILSPKNKKNRESVNLSALHVILLNLC